MNDELLKELKNAFDNVTPDFRHSKLYDLLKTELTRLGYWKQQARGNARKGYTNSPVAQQVAQIRQALKNSTVKQTNESY